MEDRITLIPYRDPSLHADISAIIRRRSSNQHDPREVFLEGLELGMSHDLLDIGCGFGYMAEAVARRAAADALVVGVDTCSANRVPFLSLISHTGRRAEFFELEVSSCLPWPDARFDVVICSYSLYFFHKALPEIRRVLRPGGRLIAVTHSTRAFTGLLRAIGLHETEDEIGEVFARFSAENGEAILRQHFESVERVDFPNELRFRVDHLGELMSFLLHKLPVLAPRTFADERIADSVLRNLSWYLGTHQVVVVEKDDTCFHCIKAGLGSNQGEVTSS